MPRLAANMKCTMEQAVAVSTLTMLWLDPGCQCSTSISIGTRDFFAGTRAPRKRYQRAAAVVWVLFHAATTRTNMNILLLRTLAVSFVGCQDYSTWMLTHTSCCFVWISVDHGNPFVVSYPIAHILASAAVNGQSCVNKLFNRFTTGE